MLLKEIIKKIDHKKVIGNEDIEIKDIQYHSSFVGEGSLFICIRGFKTDGHLYIEDALNRGAVAIVSQEDIRLDGTTVILVEDTREAMASIANQFYNQPTRKLKLIGVTGTNGKTSITYMVKSILDFCGENIGVIGTISNWIGNKEIESVRTTPEAVDLQKIFSQMVDQSINTCIMEVSSHALQLKRVEDSTYSIGLFTNLSPEHLDFHINMENYREAKKKLFYKTTSYNIINIDDFHGQIIAEEIKDLDVPLIGFGLNKKAHIYASNINMDIKGVSFIIHTPKGTIHARVKIPGSFTVYNILAAVAICYCHGIPLDRIEEALANMDSIPGRFELIEDIKDFAVIVDYAHTPDALENILKSAKMFAENRVITVFGCGGDRDREKRPIMGEISGRFSDYTIITSDNPRTEDPMAIMAMIEEGIKPVTNQYNIIENRKEAIQYAIKMASTNDIIIIAGKGHETSQILGDKTIAFDDRQVALQVAREEKII